MVSGKRGWYVTEECEKCTDVKLRLEAEDCESSMSLSLVVTREGELGRRLKWDWHAIRAGVSSVSMIWIDSQIIRLVFVLCD